MNKVDYPKIWEWMTGRRQAYEGECFDSPIDYLLEYYCIRDVDVLADVYCNISDGLTKKEFSQESIALEHDVAAIIAQQEKNGFKLDVPYATVLLANLKGRLAEINEAMQKRWPPYAVERFSEKTGKRLKDEIVSFNQIGRASCRERVSDTV